MTLRGLIATIFWTLMLVGCSKPIDNEARFDDEVETIWTTKWKWVDAIQHFEKGGHYVDSGDPEDVELDRPYVLPLLKKLETEFGLEWQAIIDGKDPGYALAALARLPDDPAVRKKIATLLDAEKATGPKAIFQQWGHKWLSLDLMEKENAEFLEGKDPPSVTK